MDGAPHSDLDVITEHGSKTGVLEVVVDKLGVVVGEMGVVIEESTFMKNIRKICQHLSKTLHIHK